MVRTEQVTAENDPLVTLVVEKIEKVAVHQPELIAPLVRSIWNAGYLQSRVDSRD